ncbi:MAG: mechanosensitive ion channel family protein [Jhaorihella sp.]
MAHLFRLCMLVLGVFVWSALPVQAQTGAQPGTAAPAGIELPDPLTPAAVREMVSRMSDDQVRSLLLERLDAVAREEAAGTVTKPGLMTRIGDTGKALLASWADAVIKVPTLFSKQGEAFANFGSDFGAGGLMRLFGFTLLALAVGYGAERLAVFLTRRRLGRETGGESQDLRSAVGFLFRRFCRELLGLVVFYIVVRFVGRSLLDERELVFAAPFVYYLIWIPRLGAAVARFVLAPKRSDLRLVNMGDHWARYLYRNLIGLFFLIGFILFIVGFDARNGVAMAEARLAFWLNTAVHFYVALIAWTARDGLRNMMRGTDPDRSEYDERAAHAYPAYAIGVAVVMWLVVGIIGVSGSPDVRQMLGHGAHYMTMFWLLAGPALDTLVRGLVRHLQPPMIGEGKVAEAAYRSTKRSYIRIGRVLVFGLIVIIIAKAWNMSITDLAASGVGGNLAGNLVEFIMISIVGYVAFESVSVYVNGRLAREQTTAALTEDEIAGEGGGSSGGSRLVTVLPLLLLTAQIAIVVVFALLAIGSLGLDITPLLAGAGVIGLAIGFGAQKLVTDIVSGVFFLIDDAFRVGEYVDVGGTTGTVEKISIRSMQLRHHRGPVHTIPYGEIAKLTNYSRDWVIMKLKFTVPFDTDPNKVKKIFKKIGAEMMEDPAHKEGFLQPFKSQGVFDFDDVGMIIRGKFMAKPGTQFTIRKEIYNRVKSEFAAAGIEFARREVRVAIPGLDDADHLSEEQKAAITGAAAGVVQQQGER